MKISDIQTYTKYPVKVPSTGEQITYRGYNVRESRMLLSAKQSEDNAVMMTNMQAVVMSCLDPKPELLTTYDFEYLFTLIRSKAVSETSDVLIRCPNCKTQTQVTLQLKDVKIDGQRPLSSTIKLTDELSVDIHDLDFETTMQIESLAGSDIDKSLQYVARSIERIYYKENIIEASEVTNEEMMKFIESMDSQVFAGIEDYVNHLPRAVIDVSYTCKGCKEQNELQVKGIENFF